MQEKSFQRTLCHFETWEKIVSIEEEVILNLTTNVGIVLVIVTSNKSCWGKPNHMSYIIYHPIKQKPKFKFDNQVLKKTCHQQSLTKDHFHEFKNINNMHWVIVVKYTMHCK
jgi:hypothetical protein